MSASVVLLFLSAACMASAVLLVWPSLRRMSFSRSMFERQALVGTVASCVQRARERFGFVPSARELCLAEIPEMIDVVGLALSAGLSFDSALELYCSRSQTILARLLSEAMACWRMGFQTREESLVALSRRMRIPALAAFASAIHDALTFGTPLAELLEDQAKSLRAERQNELEKRMEQLPVKMLIPLGTLILPAMLLSILGPLLVAAMGSV